MTINLQKPDITELKPKITVFGVGGGGGNAVNNMIHGGLQGVEFVVANTDAQALSMSVAEKVIQLGVDVTEGLGAGSHPEVGCAAAEECLTEIQDFLSGTHMAFVTAGMGGGTGTGAAPVVARAAREMGILTIGVVTKPFQFEGQGRMKTADEGILELQKHVDSLIVIPNQNLFRIANDKTTFADAFGMADQVLYSGVACITDLMVKEGLINLDFADVRSVMRDMGKAMMGTGEASGDGRAMQAAEGAISNPLLDESSMLGARGLLISITGGRDLTLFEVDEAATRIREEVDQEANIILGATFDENLEGVIRVSVVATGIDNSTKHGKTLSPHSKVEVGGAGSSPGMGENSNTAITTTEAKIKAAKDALSLARAGESQTVKRDGVTLAPFKPESTIFSNPQIEEEFRNALEEELMPLNDGFVPPVAKEPQAVSRPGVMPKVKEMLPNASQPVEGTALQEREQQSGGGNGPLGLLSKLKSSFSVREDGEGSHSVPVAPPVAPPVAIDQPAVQSAPIYPAAPEARIGNDPYAPKRVQADASERINPSARTTQDDEQLDIPAFLRRQMN